MLIIKRLTDDTEYERIGEYVGGEFDLTDEYADMEASFGPLEDQPEAQIQQRLDGPHTIAVRPEADATGDSN